MDPTLIHPDNPEEDNSFDPYYYPYRSYQRYISPLHRSGISLAYSGSLSLQFMYISAKVAAALPATSSQDWKVLQHNKSVCHRFEALVVPSIGGPHHRHLPDSKM